MKKFCPVCDMPVSTCGCREVEPEWEWEALERERVEWLDQSAHVDSWVCEIGG